MENVFMKNVKDYGAVGDGLTNDTAAIQKAINDGGMVYFPAGVYVTGTLYLKSNGGLCLDAGAVIRGSLRRSDYNADDFCRQNEVFTDEFVTGAHLIVAVGQKNITLCGAGTIDGQGRHWVNEKKVCNSDGDYAPDPERPGQMLYFCECENVRVKNLNIVNGPYWHLFFHGCENVFCNGLTIQGDRTRWTNDGIDVDCCANVKISDCAIDVGDDALTLRAHYKKLGSRRVCEKVTVSNCVLRSHRDYGIRLGVGAGTVCDCVFSNLTIEAPNRGAVGAMCMWSQETSYASTIEGIIINGAILRGRHPIEIFVAPALCSPPNECSIGNLRFSNLLLYPTEKCVLKGISGNPLKNVTIDGVTVHCENFCEESGEIFEIAAAENVRLIGVTAQSNAKNKNVSARISAAKNIEINGEKFFGDATANL